MQVNLTTDVMSDGENGEDSKSETVLDGRDDQPVA